MAGETKGAPAILLVPRFVLREENDFRTFRASFKNNPS
jgi:hypothetical protein